MNHFRNRTPKVVPIPAELRPCCCEDDCRGFQHLAEHIRIFGLDHTLHGNGQRRHFKLVIPECWNALRRLRFGNGLRSLISQAQSEHEEPANAAPDC